METVQQKQQRQAQELRDIADIIESGKFHAFFYSLTREYDDGRGNDRYSNVAIWGCAECGLEGAKGGIFSMRKAAGLDK